jgi:hypothetical protein
MKYKAFIGLFVVAVGLASCKDDCVTCSGPTAEQRICPDDYSEKSDFQNYISEYEQLEDGVCE